MDLIEPWTSEQRADHVSLLAGVHHDMERDRRSLWLTANESLLSQTASHYLGVPLANHYYNGAGGADQVVSNPFTPFMSRGRPGVAGLVQAAEASASQMLGAAAVNLNCLSGIHAMMCIILALSDPGETVMSLAVADGGHFSTPHIVSRTGRRWVPAPCRNSTGLIDAVQVSRLAPTHRPALLYLDGAYELEPQDVAALRQALPARSMLVYDVSHQLGLIMGRALPSPLDHGADAICGNTHKSFPGPHRGMIAYRAQGLAKRANDVIDGGLYSSNQPGTLIPLAISILEMEACGVDYASRVVQNARHLAGALEARGWPLRRCTTGEHTLTHQFHVLADELGEPRPLYQRFATNNIMLGFDNCLGGRPFMRLGTQEITRRGMAGDKIDLLADLLVRAAKGDDVRVAVQDVVGAHNDVAFSFDAYQKPNGNLETEGKDPHVGR